jgi:hypothetical protein
MLTQVLTATFSIFSDEPLREIVVVSPRAEELPEVVCAARNHTASDEPIESRLFTWIDH